MIKRNVCRYCKQTILMVVSKAGFKEPYNAQPSPVLQLPLDMRTLAGAHADLDKIEWERKWGHIPHWEVCAKARRARKRRVK